MTLHGARVAAMAALVISISWPGLALGQTTGGPSGAALYASYCASCHGTSGKGDGPLAASLRTRPADLTQITIHNKGTYPAEQVARIVDGRNPVPGHGGGDMPAWGEIFTKTIDQTPASEKISRLVRYLQTIQQQP